MIVEIISSDSELLYSVFFSKIRLPAMIEFCMISICSNHEKSKHLLRIPWLYLYIAYYIIPIVYILYIHMMYVCENDRHDEMPF